jgi:hypothetical protein
MICPPATSKAVARWPRRGLVVVAATSCRNNKVQMIKIDPKTLQCARFNQENQEKACQTEKQNLPLQLVL